jgi:hypothetical protein
MAWNKKDGRIACRWREFERIDSDAILHDLQSEDSSAMTAVESAQA